MIEASLKKILGGTYGGPSLSYEDGQFVIYEWFDAPCGDNLLGRGRTIKDAIEDTEKTLKSRRRLTRAKKKK